MTTTNAMRILKSAKIDFTVSEYPVDEQDLSGAHAAQMLGVSPDIVFKTLVVRGQKHGLFVCCIPVECELDLKKLAKLTGDKSVQMIKVSELLPMTGYVRGGCSPIGMKKKYPTYVDARARAYEKIYVSAGVRGQQIVLAPEQLVWVTDAQFADLTQTQ